MMAIQDVRGRYASDRAREHLRHEGHEGADTIAWAGELRGSKRVASKTFCSVMPRSSHGQSPPLTIWGDCLKAMNGVIHVH